MAVGRPHIRKTDFWLHHAMGYAREATDWDSLTHRLYVKKAPRFNRNAFFVDKVGNTLELFLLHSLVFDLLHQELEFHKHVINGVRNNLGEFQALALG